jgi:hypothetical protein
MEWLHHLGLVLGGTVLGIGFCLRLTARREAANRPGLGWGVMALGLATVFTGFAPASGWTAILGVIFALTGAGCVMMSMRPPEPESRPAPVRSDR